MICVKIYETLSMTFIDSLEVGIFLFGLTKQIDPLTNKPVRSSHWFSQKRIVLYSMINSLVSLRFGVFSVNYRG